MHQTHTYRVGDRITTLYYIEGRYVGRSHETVKRRRRRDWRHWRLSENQWDWIVGALVLTTTIALALSMPVLAYLELLP